MIQSSIATIWMTNSVYYCLYPYSCSVCFSIYSQIFFFIFSFSQFYIFWFTSILAFFDDFLTLDDLNDILIFCSEFPNFEKVVNFCWNFLLFYNTFLRIGIFWNFAGHHLTFCSSSRKNHIFGNTILIFKSLEGNFWHLAFAQVWKKSHLWF